MEISTHSAREDGDDSTFTIFRPLRYFNPLRPRGRRPRSTIACSASFVISTHSAREDGDYIAPLPLTFPKKISTHSAREDGDPVYACLLTDTAISTHSAREDGDTAYVRASMEISPFQPTPPARTETDLAGRALEHFKISTHSAREDGDNVTLIQWEL